MFSYLRLRLTLLYLGVASTLVIILVGATYALVSYYFESSVKVAMQRRMAHEFKERQLLLPPELALADLPAQAPAQPEIKVQGGDHHPHTDLRHAHRES